MFRKRTNQASWVILAVMATSGIGMAFDGNSDPLFLVDGGDATTLGRRVQNKNVLVRECSESIGWFSNPYAGILRSYFDCECPDNGGFRPSQAFALSCSLDNYCFHRSSSTVGAELPEDEEEECVSMWISHRFVLDEKGFIDREDEGSSCVDDLTRGLGPLCRRTTSPCHGILEDAAWDRYSKKRRYDICNNATACREVLRAHAGVETAVRVCPEATLRGEACRSNGFELADGCREAHESSGYAIGFSPDCGNVVPCATASCQLVNATDLGVPEGRAMRYPGCAGVALASAADQHILDGGATGVLFATLWLMHSVS